MTPEFVLSIDVNITGQPLPLTVSARNWESVRAYLDSAEFRAVAERVEFVSIFARQVTA